METLIKFNDQLIGLPVGVLVMLFAIAMGYLLRGVEWFQNKYIPLAVVVASTTLFMFLAPSPDAGTSLRIWLGRNFAMGFIFGFIAWTAHKFILAKFEDKVPVLKDWIASEETETPQPPNN